MSQKIKQDWIVSMDHLRFSEEEKDRMAEFLMHQSQEETPGKTGTPGRKLLLLILAAALVLMLFTGAAVLTRWSKSMNALYGATQKQREIAEKAGVSSMLETNAQESDIISVTDQGVTITAVQTIVDMNYARLVFRIDGFHLPEGEEPDVTIGSIRLAYGAVHYVNYFNGFYDGTVLNEAGEQVYADGSPLQYQPDSSIKRNFAAEDGSLEFYTTLTIPTPGAHIGSEVEIQIMSIGTASRPGIVRGDWTLKWKLDGRKTILREKPNMPVGDTGITLLKTEISPIAIAVFLQVDNADHRTDGAVSADFDDPVVRAALENAKGRFAGFRTKDGKHCISLSDSGFTTYYGDYAVSTQLSEYRDSARENHAVILRSSKLTNQIIDPEQVDALLFLKTYPGEKDFRQLEEDDFYIIPIR